MGTAPLYNQEGLVPLAPSPTQPPTVLDEVLPGPAAEPAAGKFQGETDGCQKWGLGCLGNNQGHSPPKKTQVPGTGLGQKAQLACIVIGVLSWSLWEVD